MITGGFSPNPTQFQQYLFFVPQILMVILMFVGSVNFAFNYHLLTGKIKKVLSLEVGLFLAIILAASITLVFAANMGFLDSVFHVVSMASSTGATYVDIPAINSNATAILITVMAIGGCAFSMSGGIKVTRLLTFGEAVRQKLALTFTKATKKTKKKPGNSADAFSAVASILLFIVLLVVFALLFSTIGVSFSEALFEVGSALSTTGASMGATTVAMPLIYKWLMIAAMTIGRVELLTILIVLVPLSVKKLRKAAESKSF
jgi:trk system potassium uptake protein